MRKYTVVRREAVVERIEDALVASGASIVTHANPRSAPFEITIRTPTGETLDLVCYAFTANEYRQGGRPPDEHRFQIKYGSDFDRYHNIFIDPEGHKAHRGPPLQPDALRQAAPDPNDGGRCRSRSEVPRNRWRIPRPVVTAVALAIIRLSFKHAHGA